jgi:histidine triad (HIT) family protein
MPPDCIFCRVANGELDAKIVHRDPDVVALEDVRPVAPVHVLVIPTRHFDNARGLDNGAILAKMFDVAHQVAREKGVAESGYRLVFNVGPDAGQSVDHVHLHVLGGRRMAWPPG